MAENEAPDTKRGRSYPEIIKQFNSLNAKILAVVLVGCLVGYHGILRFKDGSDTCQGLLTKGRYQGNNLWQPYGCMIHSLSRIDANNCLRKTRFQTGEDSHWAFIGDSRIRQLYFEILKLVDPEAEPSVIVKDIYGNNLDQLLIDVPFRVSAIATEQTNVYSRPLEKAHSSLTYNNSELSFRMTFFWRPIFNQSAVDLIHQLGLSKSVPNVVIAGSGAWDIKLSNGSDAVLDVYESNLEQVAKAANNWPNRNSKLLWKLQDPVDSSKLSEQRQVISNDLIDEYNEIALRVFQHSRFQIWKSARLVTEGMVTADDGLHLNAVTLKHHVQMLMNMYCNERMGFDDGTCCRSAESATTLQVVTFTILLVCLTISSTWMAYRSFDLRLKQRRQSYRSIENLMEADETEEIVKDVMANGHAVQADSLGLDDKTSTRKAAVKDVESNSRIVVTALGKLGLIMAYFYLCDRTTFFMKENKYYSHLNFWVPIGYVFALGFFFHEESRSTKVLHRDQTDEWKGWMQLVILIYHMTGASQVIPLYMQMRVLVSSYLFLTGFGHLSFFWNGGSASFPRLFQVLFRMNLMTVVICLCMNRPYQSYYFVPLVSFWYLVVYIVLALPPKVSSAICEANPVAYLYIIIKLCSLLAAITILYMSEVFFQAIFLVRPWKALFVTSNDEIHEWWFRWSLDRYSICYGMIFGLLYLNAQKFGLIDDSARHHLLSRTRIRFLVVVAALLGLGGYTAFTITCHSKPKCNEVHSYLAFLPIVSFIVLRNVFGPLRVRYSSFFAWFGKISLELFIGQYHVWLAADTHGVLVLIPNYPVLNVMVTTYILVCVAHEVHTITGQLVPLAVPADWKKTLRNVILFFLALVPIAIHDGMF
ncbi:N-acetylneuraminate 9-O-acetyltransferase [Daphnia magna]|uniref:Cas1p 10 TM acyl transferase domain-containing protein n=1 Tax=Daphnia magna TaxID=35525 RepID=A0ABQ9ZDL5_9CRUS|nr:N-acetylneuraminate 9-O-acetyltransferase [Daphnia magna]KAK4010994.1 hypothetical protein OUZ56_020114 [Daphnia magna]